uniref:Uncharacterized protein n=1 Tax=Nelumbo nucifera TaxID=4432 RepID=A0A822Z2A8_NELNU|nr:TPA_asm: hypothetical protein HUJ06_013485 [Nelumbo nucifera]
MTLRSSPSKSVSPSLATRSTHPPALSKPPQRYSLVFSETWLSCTVWRLLRTRSTRLSSSTVSIISTMAKKPSPLAWNLPSRSHHEEGLHHHRLPRITVFSSIEAGPFSSPLRTDGSSSWLL